MESKEFKIIFNEVAKDHHFGKAFSGWFKESPECIIVLDLQKSNFRESYYLNVKIYVQGMLGNNYNKSKDLVKKDIGDIFRRQPEDFMDVFDLESQIDDKMRRERLELLFSQFIDPLTAKALSKNGIKELAATGVISLLPAVKEQLYNE